MPWFGVPIAAPVDRAPSPRKSRRTTPLRTAGSESWCSMPRRDGHLIRSRSGVGIQPKLGGTATTGERRMSAINRATPPAVCCWVADHHAVARHYPADGGHAVMQSQTTAYPASWVDLGAASRPLGDIAHGQRQRAGTPREGAFVSDAKQTPPVPRRRAKQHRGPCGSRLASWNVKAGSAAALRSRRSPKRSQKSARQCGPCRTAERRTRMGAVRPCRLGRRRRTRTVGMRPCRLGERRRTRIRNVRPCRLCGRRRTRTGWMRPCRLGGRRRTRIGGRAALPAQQEAAYSHGLDAALPARETAYAHQERAAFAGSAGGGVLARLRCGLAGSAGGGVLASEGIRSMDGAGLQITRCDDGHADPRDVCAPAMTRRAGRAVCAETDSACSGVITIADPVDKQSSSLFYKRPRGFDFSTSSDHPLAVSLVHESPHYRQAKGRFIRRQRCGFVLAQAIT